MIYKFVIRCQIPSEDSKKQSKNDIIKNEPHIASTNIKIFHHFALKSFKVIFGVKSSCSNFENTFTIIQTHPSF